MKTYYFDTGSETYVDVEAGNKVKGFLFRHLDKISNEETVWFFHTEQEAIEYFSIPLFKNYIKFSMDNVEYCELIN
jgi:hypothetical protein